MMTFLPTDATQLAQAFPQHVGPTALYVNFDGGAINDTQAGGQKTISAYSAEPGTNTAKSIQDILYRVSEIYSPFNVQVQRIYGAGNYATGQGASTIFVGGNAANSTTTTNASGKTTTIKYDAGFTPAASSDYPGSEKGITHAPNSDDYDLGFVDPVGNFNGAPNTTNEDDQTIASAIAHEAGHTFGLAHVLSSPTNDVMSYDSSNQYFANQTFPITDDNYDPSTGTITHTSKVVPQYLGNITTPIGNLPVPVTLLTQNSFTTLAASLGELNLANDSYPFHVANPDTVDSSYLPASSPKTLSRGSTSSNFAALGSADVFVLSNSSSSAQYDHISLTHLSTLNPEILIYDSTGTTLLSAYHGGAQNISVPAYSTYKLVIGGYNGDSYGTFTVGVKNPFASTVFTKNSFIGLATLAKTASKTAFAGTFSETPIQLASLNSQLRQRASLASLLDIAGDPK